MKIKDLKHSGNKNIDLWREIKSNILFINSNIRGAPVTKVSSMRLANRVVVTPDIYVKRDEMDRKRHY
jgi:hypothetical protein